RARGVRPRAAAESREDPARRRRLRRGRRGNEEGRLVRGAARLRGSGIRAGRRRERGGALDLNDRSATLGQRVTDAGRLAMAGKPRRVAWRPESASEVAAALRQCNADGLKLVPWGGGVSLRREGAPEHYDVALDLTALSKVAIYDPEDFTVTAECGITL